MVWEGNKLGKLNAQKGYQIFLNVLLLMTMEVTAPDRQPGENLRFMLPHLLCLVHNIRKLYLFR